MPKTYDYRCHCGRRATAFGVAIDGGSLLGGNACAVCPDHYDEVREQRIFGGYVRMVQTVEEVTRLRVSGDITIARTAEVSA